MVMLESQSSAEPELPQHVPDDFLWRVADAQHQSIARLFEVDELSSQDRFPGEMSGAALQACSDFTIRSLQVTDPQVHSGSQPLPITLLQRRACQYRVLIFRGTLQQCRVDRKQPGFAVFVGKRKTVLHLFNILRRVKIVGIQEQLAQSLREQPSRRGLS